MVLQWSHDGKIFYVWCRCRGQVFLSPIDGEDGPERRARVYKISIRLLRDQSPFIFSCPFYIRQPTLRLLCISDAPTLIRVLGLTHAYASTIHSYQTFVSSVWRHMLTSSSVSCGK